MRKMSTRLAGVTCFCFQCGTWVVVASGVRVGGYVGWCVWIRPYTDADAAGLVALPPPSRTAPAADCYSSKPHPDPAVASATRQKSMSWTVTVAMSPAVKASALRTACLMGSE